MKRLEKYSGAVVTGLGVVFLLLAFIPPYEFASQFVNPESTLTDHPWSIIVYSSIMILVGMMVYFRASENTSITTITSIAIVLSTLCLVTLIPTTAYFPLSNVNRELLEHLIVYSLMGIIIFTIIHLIAKLKHTTN